MPKIIINGQEKYIDGYLLNACEEIKKMLNMDRDVVCIVDGGVGEGKSTLAQLIAAAVDPTFDATRIYFDDVETTKGIINSEQKKKPRNRRNPINVEYSSSDEQHQHNTNLLV